MPRTHRPYPPEFRAEAVRLVRESGKPMKVMAQDLGIALESLRKWVRQAEIDAGEREGLTTQEHEELQRLRREVKILHEEPRDSKKSRSLLRQGDRPDRCVFRFVEREKAGHPIAIMCRLLGVSTSGYYAWRQRVPSRRHKEDEMLKEHIMRIHRLSRGAYGAPRIHAVRWTPLSRHKIEAS